MKGTIVDLNLKRGRAVALTDDGEYVLIEVLSDEPELHDEIRGPFDEFPLGDLTIYNITSGAFMDVYIQDYGTKESARKYLVE